MDVRQAADHVELCVKDTGIGIPAAEQGRIFERFYRVDKSHSKAVGAQVWGCPSSSTAQRSTMRPSTWTAKPGEGDCHHADVPGRVRKTVRKMKSPLT